MAALPSESFCGDDLEFTDAVESGSTGNAILRHVDSGTVVKVALSVSGTTATATFEPSKTANAPSGIYRAAFVLENADGERVTQEIGNIKLLAPVDRPATQSHARKMVALLEAHIEGRIKDDEGRGLETYTVGGVPITKLSFRDARDLLTQYKRDLEAETVKARSEAGLGTKRRILVHFES